MGILKDRKVNKLSGYINDCYNNLKPEIRDSVFNGGKEQATTVFSSLSVIGQKHKQLEDSNQADVANYLSIYMYIVLSRMSGRKSVDEIADSLLDKYKEYVKDDTRAKAMIDFTDLNQAMPDFSALESSNIQTILGYVNNMSSEPVTKSDGGLIANEQSKVTPTEKPDRQCKNQRWKENLYVGLSQQKIS